MSRLLLLAVFLLAACRTAQPPEDPHPARRFLPEAFRDLHLGMPRADALMLRPRAVLQEQLISFRYSYDEPALAQDLAAVTYYFDAEGAEPLYELVLEYTTEAARDADALAVFGAPNVEMPSPQDREWRFNGGEGFDVVAWTFDRKLVVVAVLPGTEYAE